MGWLDDVRRATTPPAARLTLAVLLKAADHVAKYIPEPAIDAEAWEECEAIPLAGVRASHAIPYGRYFKQWDTNGRPWLWVNRGEVEDMPHASRDGVEVIAGAGILGPELIGVPVYFE